MRLCGGFFTLSLIYSSLVQCDVGKTYGREESSIFKLLGLFHGKKIGENYAIKIPFLVNVFIIPLGNATISSDKDILDEVEPGNDNQIDEAIPNISTKMPISNQTGIIDSDNDIEVNFRQSLNRGTKSSNGNTESELSSTSLRLGQNLAKDNIVITNSTNEINITIDSIETYTTEQELINATDYNYPDLMVSIEDDNQDLNSESSTSAFDLELPTIDVDEEQNITLSETHTINKENKTLSLSNEMSSTNKGMYLAASYNNAVIDQLSITTNSYVNLDSLLPPRNDLWTPFSSVKEKSNGFRPLAGLYYDGLLYKPLLKLPGFEPYKSIYYL